MARIVFHLEIKDGKREEYRVRHENVPEALEFTYLGSGVGLQAYNVFEKDDHAFDFMKVDGPGAIQEVINSSEM